MSELPQDEKVHCFACGTTHRGRLFRDGAALKCKVDCPRDADAVFTVSSDAELFESFRRRSSRPDVEPRFLFALLDITDKCSMRCPICYAESGGGAHVPLEMLLERARRIKAAGIGRISLSGGEPTEHPDVIPLVKALTGELGFSVAILTNGLRIAGEPGLLAQLKAAGLGKIHVSFDTLSSETSRMMRGGDYVETKLRALREAARLGLPASANVTVCDANLSELGSVFLRLAKEVKTLSYVLFQPFCDFGRRNVHDEIDRERVIRALVDSPDFPATDAREFLPVPEVPAIGLGIHPDCAAVCAVEVGDAGGSAGLKSLDDRGKSDVEAFCERIGTIRGRGFMSRVRLFAAGLRFALRRGLLFKRRRLVMAVVDNLPDARFAFADRFARCGAAVMCDDGGLAAGCFAYRTGRSLSK